MTQSSNFFFDQLSKMMTDGAGLAQGLQQEIHTLVKAQIERFTAEMDLVSREELDVVKAMAAKARQENEDLKKRLERVEGLLDSFQINEARRDEDNGGN